MIMLVIILLSLVCVGIGFVLSTDVDIFFKIILCAALAFLVGITGTELTPHLLM